MMVHQTNGVMKMEVIMMVSEVEMPNMTDRSDGNNDQVIIPTCIGI